MNVVLIPGEWEEERRDGKGHQGPSGEITSDTSVAE